jgi:toxin ParE1/3/4
MVEVIWAVRAYEHLNQIGEYIGKDSPFQARRVVQLIIKETNRIHDNIRIGHMIPELRDDNFREIKVFSYRILYKILTQEKAAIIGIVHSRRNIDCDRIE